MPQVENSTPDLVCQDSQNAVKTWFYAHNYLKHCIKLLSGYVYRVYVKHKQILCFDLGLNPKIYNYSYANIPKFKKKSKIQNISGSKHFK